MNGERAFFALTDMQDDLILEAAEKLSLMKPSQPHLRRKSSPLARFLTGGWGVALLCAVISVSVVCAIVWAGQNPPVTPPDGTTTDDATQSSPETESESETRLTLSCQDGHHVESWTIEREPTCYVNGLRNATCPVCGNYVTESIDPLPHTHENGYCTVCGTIEGADMRFIFRTQREEDGSVGARISRRDGAEGEKIILPNLIYDAGTEKMVPVTVISGELFEYDSTLREIVIPDTVHTIEKNAFDHCTNLQNVRFPSGLKKIGSMAFTACNSFTEIHLPEGLTEIGDMAFGYCPGLTEVVLPDSVVTLGDSAFTNCKRLRKVSLPDGVTKLDDGLFAYCPVLSDLRLPAQLTHVGNHVFCGCTSLTAITLPDTVTRMGNFVFQECSSLSSFTYPPLVTEVGVNHFKDCTSLKEIILHDAITSIDLAFENCTSLTAIHIPASVTNLSGVGFSGCTSLTTLTVDENNPVYTAVNNCIIQKDKKILVLGGCNAVIPSDGSVTEIGDSAFRGRRMQSITIPDPITKIGMCAFSGCSQLQSVSFPGSLTEIDSYAFQNCTALKSVSFPSHLESLGNNLFENCTGLKSISIPVSLTSVRYGLFAGCVSVNHVDYGGTQAQWKALTLGVGFGSLEQPHSDFTVSCTDGDLVESLE